MNQQAAPTGLSGVTLDKLETLVEKAVSTIDALQAENAGLKAELKQNLAAAAAASAELQELATRVRDLEQAEAKLKVDAAWCRWFRGKYSGSTFYQHIDTAYRNDHQPVSNAAQFSAKQHTFAA